MQATRRPHKASLRSELASITASEKTAVCLLEAARRLADIAAHNEVIADEVARLRRMAEEYEDDAATTREDLLNWYSIEDIEKAMGL